jgi:hypothetical protein
MLMNLYAVDRMRVTVVWREILSKNEEIANILDLFPLTQTCNFHTVLVL